MSIDPMLADLERRLNQAIAKNPDLFPRRRKKERGSRGRFHGLIYKPGLHVPASSKPTTGQLDLFGVLDS